MCRSLCTSLARIYDVDLILNNRIIDRILHKRGIVRHAPQPLEIRFVFGEEKLLGVFTMELVTAKPIMPGFDHSERGFPHTRLASGAAQAPGTAEPNRWEEMQDRRFGTAIRRGRATQHSTSRCRALHALTF